MQGESGVWRDTDTDNGYAMLHVAKIISGCHMGSLARAGNVAYSNQNQSLEHYKYMGLWRLFACVYSSDFLAQHKNSIIMFVHLSPITPVIPGFVSDETFVVKMSYN